MGCCTRFALLTSRHDPPFSRLRPRKAVSASTSGLETLGCAVLAPKDFTPWASLGYMARIKPEFDRRNVKIIGLALIRSSTMASEPMTSARRKEIVAVPSTVRWAFFVPGYARLRSDLLEDGNAAWSTASLYLLGAALLMAALAAV